MFGQKSLLALVFGRSMEADRDDIISEPYEGSVKRYSTFGDLGYSHVAVHKFSIDIGFNVVLPPQPHRPHGRLSFMCEFQDHRTNQRK